MGTSDLLLVTGASGFVGSAVARAAVAQGLKVRVLVRPTSRRDNLDGLAVEVAVGDICDSVSMQRALAGVRYLLHVAADYRLWAPNARELVRTNVEGTRVVMEEALRAGIEKIVYTSSVATLRTQDAVRGASASDYALVDEGMPSTEDEAIGAYKRSKIAAERLVEHLVATRRLPAVIVNPSTPVGPRDIKPTPTGRIIVQAALGRIPAYVDTGLNLVHVDDVAVGHLLALQRGVVGERYILGGDNVMLRDILRVVATMTGRPAATIRLPRWPLYPLALAAQAVARLGGRDPFLTLDGLKMSCHMMFFSSHKAQRELGYHARSHVDGLSDALDWFREKGYLN
ncbi:MAG: NAD-dependent epimerase/dehydratase family protein [Burkholderiaceae bacterium]|nr:MAG: NAD-dependent epimerase/dehydratase family protein [Burkholderiaceae bacterium]